MIKLEKIWPFARLVQISTQKFFFVGFTSTRLYTCRKLSSLVFNCKENLLFKLKKMAKNLTWVWFRPTGPKFGPPILDIDVRHCRKASLYATSRKTYDPNHQNFFFKNLALSVTRYHGQLSSRTKSEKK